MSDQRRHHHHRKDYASRFKERSLLAIEYRRKADKWLKITLMVFAILMVLIVIFATLFG